MTPQQLAEQLQGSEYGFSLTTEQKTLCNKHGLVVLYGHSDDLVECDGAIIDEIGAYEGTKFRFDKYGFLQDWEDLDKDDKKEVQEYLDRDKDAKEFIAKWNDGDGVTWTIETKVEHATFDIIEDDEVFSRGIVLSINAL